MAIDGSVSTGDVGLGVGERDLSNGLPTKGESEASGGKPASFQAVLESQKTKSDDISAQDADTQKGKPSTSPASSKSVDADISDRSLINQDPRSSRAEFDASGTAFRDLSHYIHQLNKKEKSSTVGNISADFEVQQSSPAGKPLDETMNKMYEIFNYAIDKVVAAKTLATVTGTVRMLAKGQ